MHPMSQLAFDLDDVAPEPPPPVIEPPWASTPPSGRPFLAAIAGDAATACLAAARQLQDGHHSVLEQHRREVQRTRYDARPARERRYLGRRRREPARGPRPGNRVGESADRAARRRDRTDPPRGHRKPSPRNNTPRILALGADLDVIWSAPTTTRPGPQGTPGHPCSPRSPISLDRPAGHADVVLRWKGGALTDLRMPLTAQTSAPLRTAEDTIDLVRRLAVHYPDARIAGILLNRRYRSTATGLPFTAGLVQALRHHGNIPRHQPDAHTSENGDQLFTIVDAAAAP